MLAPGGVHVAQNAYMSRQLAKGSFQKNMLDKARVGFGLGAHPSKAQAFKNGVLGGVVPEVSIVGDEMGKMGKDAIAKLKKLRGPEAKMDKYDVLVLRKLLKGEFTSLQRMSSNPRVAGKLEDMLEVSNIPGKDHIKFGLTNKDHPMAKSFLQDSEKMWQENKLTGKFMTGISDQLGKKFTHRSAKRATAADYVGRGAGLIGITVADPITGIVNTAKHLYGNHHVQGKTLNKVRGQLQKI